MTQREEFEKALREMKIDAFHSLELNDNGNGYKNISTTILFAGFRLGLKAAKVQAVPQWIPVSERLPENEGTYFCLGHNGTPFVCLLRNKKYEGYVWLRNTGTRVVDGITHWMPIPSLPEQNK